MVRAYSSRKAWRPAEERGCFLLSRMRFTSLSLEVNTHSGEATNSASHWQRVTACQECAFIQSKKPVGRKIGMPKGFSRANKSWS